MITTRFSKESPVSCAQGRHGEVIIVQGGGVRPARSDLAGPAKDAGMDEPTAKPSVTVNTPARYYIARTDVYKPGLCYYAPPPVSFTSEKGVEKPGGREAKASSFLAQSVVSEIRVDDGGKYYIDQPSVELGATYGSGASLEAGLSGTPSGGGTGGDPYTGITEWQIIQAPPYLDDVGFDDGLTWYYAGGDVTVPASSGSADFKKLFSVPANGKWDGVTRCPDPSPRNGFNYTVTGATGTGATVKLTFSAPTFNCSSTNQTPGGIETVNYYRGARQIISAKAVDWGKGYSSTEPVVLRIPSASGNPDRDIILHGVTSGSPANTTAESFGVKDISIKDGGKGYLVAPQIKITSSSGFGAFATCKVKGGKITEVTLESGGNGYKTPPTIEVVAGGAEAFAVARPHLRGKYQCYYRYIDDTPEDRGGPIPSNLSPVLEVDAGEGAKSLSWVVPPPKGRATKLELWRTTSNQATTLYRVSTLALTGGSGAGTPTVPGNPTDPPVDPPTTPGGGAIAIVNQPTLQYFPPQQYFGYTNPGYFLATASLSNPQNLSFSATWYGKNRKPDGWTYGTDPVFCQTDWELLTVSTGYSPTALHFSQKSSLSASLGVMWRSGSVWTLVQDGAYQFYRCVISFTEPGAPSPTLLTTDSVVFDPVAGVPTQSCGLV